MKQLTKWDELKLIARCVAADDRDAFGRLVEAYQPALLKFLVNMTCGDAALADDLAQETFIKAYLSLRSFRGLSRFKTWLFRIACNEYLSWKRRYDAEVPTDRLPDMPDVGTDRLSRAAIVDSLLASLPDRDRLITTLYYLEDMPTKDVAKAVGITDGAVRTSLCRIRARLKKYYEND